MSEHESHLTTETLIAMILLIVFIVCGPIFEKINFHYAHESGVVMICGIVISFIINSFNEDVSSKYIKTHILYTICKQYIYIDILRKIIRLQS